MNSSDSEHAGYHQAGLAYLVLGSLILLVTVASPGLAAPERRADLVHLIVGLPFFALFAALVAYGDRMLAAPVRWVGVPAERARRWGLWGREKLVMLLSLSALGRTLVFLGNGLGTRPRLGLDPPGLTFESVPPSWRMLVNAALMAVILVLLVRASWVPFLERLRSRERVG